VCAAVVCACVCVCVCVCAFYRLTRFIAYNHSHSYTHSHIISNSGMPEAERRRLLEFAGLAGAESMAVGNLVHLGVTVDALKKVC